MTKGILKRHSLSGVSVASSISDSTDAASQEDSPRLKRVSFDGAEPARVFEADEWDRSPAEVTLRLTYKDVVELRELDVSLVRTGPLRMERTPSRRPTRQRTIILPSTQPNKSSTDRSHGVSPSACPTHHDDSMPCHSSSLYTPPSPHLSSLPPLQEDGSSPPASPSPTECRARGHEASLSDSYFTFHTAAPSGSPPGLVVCSPRLHALSSPTFVPPSPVTHSSPLSRSPSPNPSSHPRSSLPLCFHRRSGSMSPRFKKQSLSDSQKPIVFPALSRRASVPDELVLAAGKGELTQSTGRESPSPKWKPLRLASVDANSSSPNLILNKNAQNSPMVSTPVKSWKARSLVGWELKRNGGGNGKLGFGLVRKGSTGA